MIEGESGVLAVSPPWDLGASGGESPPGDSTRVVLGAGYQSNHVRQSPGGDVHQPSPLSPLPFQSSLLLIR